MSTTQYAVMHTEKGHSTGGALGNHIDREPGHEHCYPHADPKLREQNKNYPINKYCLMPLERAVKERLFDGYNSKRQIRSDAVKYMTTVLTGTHERMTELAKHPEALEQWVEANFKFMKKEFGEDNIVRFTLHMDEKTPHIHCVHVPLTSDGRLSAKEVMGNIKALQERQDRYAQAMEPFGLVRGIRGTKKDHDDLYTYYGRISQIEAATEANKPKEYNRFTAAASAPDINQQLQMLHAALVAAKLEKEKAEKRIKDLEGANKQKELEIEKQKKAQLDIIQEKHKTLRAFGYAKELLAKVKLGHELKPEEKAFIEKSVVQYQETLQKQAMQDEYAKKANQEIQERERRKGLGL